MQSTRSARGARTRFDQPFNSRRLALAAASVVETLEARRLLSGGAPAANAGGPYTAYEGGSVTLNGTLSSDSGAVIQKYEWDLDYDGTRFDIDATGATPTFSAAGVTQPFTRTIALRVTDNTKATSIATSTMNVLGSPPALSASGPSVITAGQTYTLNLAATEYGLDTLTTWNVDWGDGTISTLPGSATTASHVFAQSPTEYHIAVTGTDPHGTYPANQAALDPTFGTDGLAVGFQQYYESGTLIAGSPLGDRIYAATNNWNGVFRFNLDGTLDSSFGAGGLAQVNTNSGSSGGPVTGLAVQPDGRVVVYGTEGIELKLVRYNADGTPDKSFGTLGTGVVTDTGGSLEATPGGMWLQPDGKIVIAGYTQTVSGAVSPLVERFNSNGTLDPTFGTGGRVATNTGATVGTFIGKILPLADGSFIAVAGDFINGLHGGFAHPLLLHYTSSGALDTSFGTNGMAEVSFGDVDTFNGTTALLQPDGRILIVASTVQYNQPYTSTNLAVARLMPNGQPDPTFGNGGTETFDLTNVDEEPDGVTLDDQGRILVTFTKLSSSGSLPYITRLNADGSLDGSFGMGGVMAVSVPTSPPSGASVRLGSPTFVGGKLYLVSMWNSVDDIGLVRMNDGPLVVREEEPPVVAPVSLGGTTFDEGSTVTCQGSFSDPDVNDAHQVTINWGDGSAPSVLRLAPGVLTFTVQHLFADDNPTGTPQDVAHVQVSVYDGLATGTASLDVTVVNVAPTVASLGADKTGSEGTPIVYTAAVTDPGTDTFSYHWTVTNGNGATIADTTASSASYAFTPPDNGYYTLSLAVTDDDGGVSNTVTAHVTATNVAPTANAGGNRSGAEGTPITFTGSFTDPGAAENVTVLWHVTSSNGQVLPDGTGLTYAFTPVDNGTYTATFTATDKDGGVGASTATLSIYNVVPTLVASGPAGAEAGVPYTLSLASSDPGADTISGWTITWGDGSTSNVAGNADSVAHTYNATGSFTISAKATDEDGTYAAPSRTVLVANQPSLTSTDELDVYGTSAADTIVIGVANGTLTTSVNGVVHTFDAASITSVNLQALAATDNVTLNGNLPNTTVDLGDGSDVINVTADASASGVIGTGALTISGTGTGSKAYYLAYGPFASVTINGGTGADFLTAHGDSVRDTTFMLSPAANTLITSAGTESFTLNSVENYTYYGGAGLDTFDLPGWSKPSSYLTMRGAGGNDTFNFGTDPTDPAQSRMVGFTAGVIYAFGSSAAGNPNADVLNLLDGGDTGNDAYTLYGNGAGFYRNGVEAIAAIAKMSVINVQSGSGDDTLTMDFSTTYSTPPSPLVTFDGGGGANTIAYNGTSSNDTLTASAGGTLSFTGGSYSKLAASVSNVQSLRVAGGNTAGDAVIVTGGQWQLNADGTAGAARVAVTVNAGGSVFLPGNQHLAALTLNGGAARLATTAGNTLTLAGALSITNGGKLDLGASQLLLSSTASPLQTVRAYIQAAYDGGKWDGAGGLTSSAVAANTKQFSLGYAAAGQSNVTATIPPGSTLVTPTMFGDTNLDGIVTNGDISAMIAGGKYLDGTTNNSWALGDWNYDGRIDNNDVSNLIASGNYLSGQTYTAPAAAPAAAPSPLRAAATMTATGSITNSSDPATPVATTAAIPAGTADVTSETTTGVPAMSPAAPAAASTPVEPGRHRSPHRPRVAAHAHGRQGAHRSTAPSRAFSVVPIAAVPGKSSAPSVSSRRSHRVFDDREQV